MKKEQLELIIDFLESVYEDDRKLNKAIKDFIEIVAPGEFALIVDGKLTTIFSVMKIVYPRITNLLEYYFFEAKNMKGGGGIEFEGKTYNYSNKEGVIQSMIAFGYIE